MFKVYKFSKKVCGKCEGENPCEKKNSESIIKAGEYSPAIRRNKGQIGSYKADRKEQMEDDFLYGKYRILRLLANGSGGEVFLAEHKALGERRIIKRLAKSRPFFEERKQEAHTLKLLHHPAIPRIYDIEEDASACYIIEEDMGGETLFDFLFRQKCLPTSFISQYSIQLCEIIEYLHQNGILYLDVKPENIIIRGDTLALIDFGGAIRKEKPSDVVFGTTGYAAPEQYSGMADESSDVYGIGCVMGVMLGEESKGRKELFRIYEKCVQSIPAKRYPNVSALKYELQRLTRGKKRKHGTVPRYIGVAGVHEETESGAFCTMLAAYLNERENGRIACIDLSDRHVFEGLYRNLFGTHKKVPDRFKLQGICYVPNGIASDIGTYAMREYTTLILHFGRFSEQIRDDFFRCDSRFLHGNLYPWRLHDWKLLSDNLSGLNAQREMIAVITGGEKELLPTRFARVIELPFTGDVLSSDRKIEKLFRTLF